jgi:hypothetical protein
MKEFIISEVKKIFEKAILRYAKEYKSDVSDVSIVLYLTDSDEVGYELAINGEVEKIISFKEIRDVFVYDIKQYDKIVPPYIQGFLVAFREEYKSDFMDVSVCMNEDEIVQLFLYNDGRKIKEILLDDLIKVDE